MNLNKNKMIVEILKSDPRLGIKKGQWYLAEPYSIDPSSKITLLRRITKSGLRKIGKEPMCNQYRNEVKILAHTH